MRASALAVALSRLNLERPFQVRVTEEIHDRFVIPPSGPVDMLGTSLSGVGKALSVLVEIGEPSAGEIRRAHGRIWAAADDLQVPVGTQDAHAGLPAERPPETQEREELSQRPPPPIEPR